MLSRVAIQNFKSIGDQGVELKLAPLTFLVGPNGGGKSSIMEAIAVASQKSLRGNLVEFQDDEISIADESTDGFIIEIDMHAGSSYHGTIFWDPLMGEDDARHEDRSGGAISKSDMDFELSELVTDFEGHTYRLSSVRGDVPRDVLTYVNPDWVGVNGDQLVPLLARILTTTEYESVSKNIERWANRFGLRSLKAGLRGSQKAGSDYLDERLGKSINLALASSGSRQILTVITQLFWSRRNSLLLIEEPEISLHPQAQVDVIEMFAEAIKEDKQIIAATHSLFMLQGIGYAIIKGWLSADQVAVYHVEKKKNTGTVVKRLPLSEKGYIKGWVPSFTKVERKLLTNWLDSLPEE
jgi:predicted ATPase